MSVVNKMLRDLESREHAHNPSAQYIVPSANKLWLNVAIVLGMIVLSVGVSVYINTYHGFALSNPTDTHDKQQSSAQAASNEQDTSNQELANQSQSANSALHTKNVSAALPVDKGSLLVTSHLSNAEDTNGQDTIETQQLSSKNTADHQDETDAKSASHFSVSPSDGAQSSLSSLRAQAHMAAQNQNDELVIKLLKQILDIQPKELRTRKQLAALLFSKKQFEDASTVLKEGLALSPADSSLRLMLSRIFFKVGDNANAFVVLQGHPFDQLANDEFVSFRAALAEKIGQYDSAQKDYQMLVARNPKIAKWWLGLGVSQDKQKLVEQAIISYEQAQSLNQLPKQVESFVAERLQLLARQS